MNNFFIDVLRKIYLATQKHGIAIKVSFDGGQSSHDLATLVSNLVSEDGVFDLKQVFRETLEQPYIIQSNILIILTLLY